MADGRRQANGRIFWSVKMNSDLLECKRKALEWVRSETPPRLENGRKMGYMQVMKDMWEEKGYGDFALTRQNLRDQAARLEKTVGSVADSLSAGIGRSGRRREEESLCEELGENINGLRNANSCVAQEDSDLHMTERVSPGGVTSTISQEARTLLESSVSILGQINTCQGEYQAREFDTRIKGKPTKRDLENINQALTELMRQQKVLPTDNPFTYLWIANCVLYSVVISFLLYKGWKKKGPKRPLAGESKQQKRRRLYVEKVSEIRKQISIAKAEADRLKENRKLTKKGRRNREILQKECRTLSIASLVGYMEKKKASLRKLKKGLLRDKKLEEARLINQQFKDDTSRVYADIRKVLANDKENERPIYVDPGKRDERGEEKLFGDIEEASSFWKELWEGIMGRKWNWKWKRGMAS